MLPKMSAETKSKTKAKRATMPRLNGRYHDDDSSKFSVTIGVSVNEAFEFFRNFENLPHFMKDLKSIEVLTPLKSHWVVELKDGLSVEWDAEITSERAGEMISWRSLEGSEIETEGSIWFSPAPEGLGTVVGLAMETKIPGGKVTELLTKLTGEDPDSLIFINLRRLKAFLEVGEIATTDGQSSGRDKDASVITQH